MQAGFQAFLVKIAEMLPRASFEGFSLITQQAWSPVFHQNLGNEQVLKPWVRIGWKDSSIPTDSLAKNNRSIALPIGLYNNQKPLSQTVHFIINLATIVNASANAQNSLSAR